MAKSIPLPRYEELPEVVLFHRSHPASSRLLLQVPTGTESAETFVIELNQPGPPPGEYDPRTDHKGWVKRLPNSQALMDKLAYEAHVAYYYSRAGTVIVLEDPDTIPWVRVVMALARQEAPAGNSFNAYFARRKAQARTLLPSPLRRSLEMRPGGVQW